MIQVYAVDAGNLARLGHARLPRRRCWRTGCEGPGLLGLDVAIIGRQVQTKSGGFIDILAIDREGDLTIVELKRDRTPREVVAQVLDYASWVNTLSTKDVREVASGCARPLRPYSPDAFGIEVPEDLNGAHNMVIVASELDPSSKRIVEYLSKVHDVGINTLFFSTSNTMGSCSWSRLAHGPGRGGHEVREQEEGTVDWVLVRQC